MMHRFIMKLCYLEFWLVWELHSVGSTDSSFNVKTNCLIKNSLSKAYLFFYQSREEEKNLLS